MKARATSATRAIAARPARPGPAPVLSCRLKVTLPKGVWMRAFSVAHPSLRVDVVGRLEVDRGLVLFEVEIPATDRESWAAEIRRLPEVRSVDLIDVADGIERYQVLFAGRTFLPLLKRAKLMRHLPFPIQGGVATWTVVAPLAKIRRLLDELRSTGVEFGVESVRRGPFSRSPASLTPRQQEILRRAVEEGYFDVPRRISLTRLAPRLGVATSTLSVTLAVIERKLIATTSWLDEANLRADRTTSPS